MNASDILDLTVAILQQSVTKMMTFEWHKKVEKLPNDEEKKNAKLLLADCEWARLVLENVQLDEISQDLQDNEDALKKGRDALKKALERLDSVKNILNAANSLLSIVSKIVKL